MVSRALLWLLLLLPSAAKADSIDDAIKRKMAAGRWPGLTFAVVKNGKIIRLGAYGYGNLEWKAPTTIDTRFEVASVSKMVTGAAFRILIEDGKVDPDDPVSKFFGDLPASWTGMRVRHLITMSSGLPEDFGSEFVPYDKDVVVPDDDKSLLAMFGKLPMVAPVGTRFSHSSANYAMMGLIISKISGMPYAQYVQKRIFDPAGMAESSIIDNAAVVPHRAEGYRMEKGVIKRGRFLGQYLHSRADDSVLTTTRDMAKFVIALESRKIVGDPEKLWEGSVSDTGKPLDHAYGWMTDTCLGHRRLSHSGGYRTGFHTLVARYPDDGVSVIVFSNCDYSEVGSTVLVLTRKFIPGFIDPEVESTRPDPDPAGTAKTVATLRSIVAGRIDDSLMESDALEPVGLVQASGFLKEVKTFAYAGRQKLAKPISMHGRMLVDCETIKLTTSEGSFYLTVYRDEAGKIAYVESTA